jgi:hypothetical protein
VQPWPEADRLFRSNPLWLGSDDAYSIPLPGDRTLWLFGDTFVAPQAGADRRECHFVRNSIGIQEGRDPVSASIGFHWGDGSIPTDFFVVETGWLWPLHGLLIDGKLLLFFMKVRSPRPSSGGLDKTASSAEHRPLEAAGIEEWVDSDSLSFFDVYGWGAFMVHNPNDAPDQWKKEELPTPTNDLGIVLGAGVLLEDDWLYMWGWTQERDGYLARVTSEDASRGDLSRLEWLSGDDWLGKPEQGAVALPHAQTEFTVHRLSSGLLGNVQAMGLDPADLTIRWAKDAAGPWTEPEVLYRIPESERPNVIAYAGKAHPHLEGADLVLTYASNGDSADITLEDSSIYYPRFVKVSLSDG